MRLRATIVVLGILGAGCFVANCGGDDTGEVTPGTGGSAGKGTGGSAGKGTGGSSGASTGGSSGSATGGGGSATGGGGMAGMGGTAGAAGKAGSGGTPAMDAGDGAARDGSTDGATDGPKESGTDAAEASSSSDSGGSTDSGADAASSVDSGADSTSSVDAGVDAGSSSDDATAADASVDVSSSADASDGATGSLVINEIVSQGTDYVEFYNPGDGPIDISGWWFTDNNPDGGAATHVYTFAAGTIVPSHGFFLVSAAPDSGNLLNVSLGDSDSLILHDNTGAIIEQETWTTHRNSDSRCPDGTGPFNNPDGGTNGKAQTPGAANSCN